MSHATILRSYFNGKVGKKIELIHYAIQLGSKIYEFGRYDGTSGKPRVRSSQSEGEETVTAWKITDEQSKEILSEINDTFKGDWTVTHNCVSVSMAIIRKHAPPECIKLAENGENNFKRVIKHLIGEIAW